MGPHSHTSAGSTKHRGDLQRAGSIATFPGIAKCRVAKHRKNGTSQPHKRRGRPAGHSEIVLLAEFGIDDDGDRAVIDEADDHLSTELAGLNRFAEILLQSLNKFFVKGNCEIRPGRAAVRRSIAFSRAGEKSELTDEKNFPLHVLDGTIHDTGFIVEDAQANDFPAEPFDIFRRVGLFDRE